MYSFVNKTASLAYISCHFSSFKRLKKKKKGIHERSLKTKIFALCDGETFFLKIKKRLLLSIPCKKSTFRNKRKIFNMHTDN